MVPKPIRVVACMLAGFVGGVAVASLPGRWSTIGTVVIVACSLAWSVYSLVDLRHRRQHLAQLAAAAEEYLAHYDHRGKKA